MATVLLEFQTIFERLFIFAAEVVGPFANRALHFYHVVLGHIF